MTEGSEVLDKIRAVPTSSRNGHQDVPTDPVIIESIEVVDD
jgi:peptidyl-prolyl cis-trans isomerase B (cyclophilin B)